MDGVADVGRCDHRARLGHQVRAGQLPVLVATCLLSRPAA